MVNRFSLPCYITLLFAADTPVFSLQGPFVIIIQYIGLKTFQNLIKEMGGIALMTPYLLELGW